MSLPVHTRAVEWIFRTRALRDARAREASPDLSRLPSVQQARLLIEVARRVLEPVDPLPPGDRAAVVLPLYRAAIQVLLAPFGEGGSPAPDLASLWAGAPAAVLARVETDPEARRRMQLWFLSPATVESPRTEEMPRLRRFAESLAEEVAGPPRQVDRIRAQRWFRMLLLGLVVALGAVGVRALLARPDLAKGRPFWASSRSPSCPAATLPCANLMFHTDEELNPWVEIDLGLPRVIRRIEVRNRADCCTDRAVPLVAEVSSSGTKWTEVGRRTTEFASWTAKFPPVSARYVRLRVPRRTTFHLQGVAVR